MRENIFINNRNLSLDNILSCRFDAQAEIEGSAKYPEISGLVRFYQTKYGVIVYARVNGLPYSDTNCENRIFAFHIHNGTRCSGDESDPFLGAGTHFNPNNCKHPHHAGDLPPLFGNNGFALSAFLTNRFKISDIIGKAIIIHEKPDDFTTDPTGNAGNKIACGIIKNNCRT